MARVSQSSDDARNGGSSSDDRRGGSTGLDQLKDGWQSQALEKGLIGIVDLRAAQQAASSGRDVAEVLLEAGKLSEEQLAQLKAEAAGLVYIDVLDYQADPKALELVQETVARKHTLLPLYCIGNTLAVAMGDPWNALAIDELRLSTKLPIIQPVLASPSAIRKAIERHYGHKMVDEASRRLASPEAHASGLPGSSRLEARPAIEPAGEVPVAKLLDALLAEALERRASDIHFEPEEEHIRIRFRIDGVLQEIKLFPVGLHEALSSRIKLLAKLDITEHRLPQDGHLSVPKDGQEVDMRISTYPTVYGENVVIRLLDHTSLRLSLTEIGLGQDLLAQLKGLIDRPYGMVLVTGPTGSGKTTTLYASLSEINSMTKNIMTIEDPVEYHLPLIRQTQVNLKAGVTFAVGLRSLLRQDPDVIMVGEIRDQETAEIAIHAALTGHLVLSTLHTNDAIGAIARLLDMGVESYLLSSTLLGVLAQRLVRKICTHCQEGSRPSPELRERHPELTVVYRGRGCRFCREAGFLGRLGLFELFRVDEQAKQIISARQPSHELTQHARSAGMRNLRRDGLLKVQQGLTSLDELDRVVPASVFS